MTVNAITELEIKVGKHPEKHLFTFFDGRDEVAERHTYGSFYQRVEQIASHLIARNLKPQSRVLVVFPPGLEMICGLFACAKAGVIAVPMPSPSRHKIANVIGRIVYSAIDCDASAILTSATCVGLLEPSLDSALTSGIEALQRQNWIIVEEIGDCESSVKDRRSSDVFFIQYTSGSTSDPKGVIVSHENILVNRALAVDHDDAVGVSWLPQHHDMGLIGYFIYSALSGAETYAFSPESFIQRPSRWLQYISDYQATASSAPNFAFEMCLQKARVTDELLENLDLSSIRILQAAAEPIRVETYQKFLNRFSRCGLKRDAFHVAYGLAENTIAVSSYGTKAISIDSRELKAGSIKEIGDASEISFSQQLMSCGTPLGDNLVAIVDPDRCVELKEGVVGEIWVKGGSKALGYWNRPELNKAVFNARLSSEDESNSGWLRTGDLGFLLGGELYVCGRCKDVIIVRGQNFYPQDIEAAIESASPLIRSASVAAFAIDEQGNSKVVVVAEAAGSRIPENPEKIIGYVRNRVGVDIDTLAFIAPKSMPKTSSGKIRRREAKRMFLNDEFRILSKNDRALNFGTIFDEGSNSESFFGSLWSRYGLRGDEECTLIEAGVDSLDLVMVLHRLKDILKSHGVQDFAENLDAKLVQETSIADLTRIEAYFKQDPNRAIGEICGFVRDAQKALSANEAARMQADRFLSFRPQKSGQEKKGDAESILLTGGTGFLGPFLIANLLNQSNATVMLLIRGGSVEEARNRLRGSLKLAGVADAQLLAKVDERVEIILGDIASPSLGLNGDEWRYVADKADKIFHNAAMVNYIYSYSHLRAPNVVGTNEILRLAFDGRLKEFNYISTTFIFGWAQKAFLYEEDNNDQMQSLDFGYSQSKWVSEQLVLDARRHGLPVRVFRPSLITPSLTGGGSNIDITIRLLAFMIKHGISVNARNQISFTPAEYTANNIVAISHDEGTINRVFHVVRDDYANMEEITEIIESKTRKKFDLFSIPEFVPEVIKRCTRDDPLFPLLDFLIASKDHLTAMEHKRYVSANYQLARNSNALGLSDPPLPAVVDGILKFMSKQGIL